MSTLTKAEGEAFGKKGNDVFRKIETFPIPVIAAVNGFALGGGCEISMSCDIRICSDNAVFGQPEVGLGITPGFGGTQRLARLVGAGMAKQMIYTARNIKADEAYRIGLVNAVYTQEELLPAAEKMAAGIAKNAPIAVRNCKKAINEGLDADMDQAIVIEEKLFGDLSLIHISLIIDETSPIAQIFLQESVLVENLCNRGGFINDQRLIVTGHGFLRCIQGAQEDIEIGLIRIVVGVA